MMDPIIEKSSLSGSNNIINVDLERGTTTTNTTTTSNSNITTLASGTTTTTATTTTTVPETTTNIAQQEAIPASSIRQHAMSGFAGLGFITSLLSMMAEYSTTAIQHPAIVISGCLGLILSPYAKFQQEKLTHVKALEQTNLVLQNELQFLQEQNDTMTKHVHELNTITTKLHTLQSTLSTLQSTNIQSLHQFEQRIYNHYMNTITTKLHTLQSTLSTLQSTNIQSLHQFEQQIIQSRIILQQYHSNTQAMILQNLITILVNCDTNHTLTLEDTEIDTLISSLESIHNVQFNRSKIRQLIIQDHHRNIYSIMEIARNLIMNTVITKEDDTCHTTTTTTNTTTNTSSSSSSNNNNNNDLEQNDSIFSYIEN